MPRLTRRNKQILSIVIVLVTAAVFIYFFVKHPAIREQLGRTPPDTLALLLALYLLFVVSVGAILVATVQMCGASIPRREGLLLTMYSSIINFFGPLQSGPAFRAAYLKAKHNVSLRKYAGASLVYYAFYGIFSLVLLFTPLLGWYTALLFAILLLVGYFGWKKVPMVQKRLAALSVHGLSLLALATLAQVLIMVVIYFVELHTILPHISLERAMSYTGAANLALFVSLTPGAIGFRESFLVFSERLHHVSGHDIVTANIIDRGVYVVMLLLLLVVILATHAQKKLKS